jgi:hypothetical protein
VGLGDQSANVVEGPVLGLDGIEVRDVVATVPLG